MTNSSYSSSPAGGQLIASPFGLPIFEKLSKTNLQLWKLQVLPAIRGAQMEGFLDGSNPAPPKEIDVKVGETVTKLSLSTRSTPSGLLWISRF